MTGIFIRGKFITETNTHSRPGDDGDRDWSNGAISQRTVATIKS
jgi:hypothetical protein